MLEKSLRPRQRPAGLKTVATQDAPQKGAEDSTVTRAATQQAKVNLNGLMLLGTFGKEGGQHALLRQPGGRVIEVKSGGRLNGAKVVAIADGTLILSRNGRTQRLNMP